jgi:hypothetical protein
MQALLSILRARYFYCLAANDPGKCLTSGPLGITGGRSNSATKKTSDKGGKQEKPYVIYLSLSNLKNRKAPVVKDKGGKKGSSTGVTSDKPFGTFFRFHADFIVAQKAIDTAEYILCDMDAASGEYSIRVACHVKYLLARLYKLKGESKSALLLIEQCFSIFADVMKQYVNCIWFTK